MRKNSSKKWVIPNLIIAIILAATYYLITQTSLFKQYELPAPTHYYLLNSQNKRVDTQVITLTQEDLHNNQYLESLYLVNLRESSYLRIFVTVSKQKDNEVYSLNDFNDSELPYTLTYNQNWSNGTSIAESLGNEDAIGFYWRYYNYSVDSGKVQIFNGITFNNGIED